MTGMSHRSKGVRIPLRAVLSLLDADGRAHCAYVYPITVNGASARGADPYANDQDWGLYFALKTL